MHQAFWLLLPGRAKRPGASRLTVRTGAPVGHERDAGADGLFHEVLIQGVHPANAGHIPFGVELEPISGETLLLNEKPGQLNTTPPVQGSFFPVANQKKDVTD